MGNSKFMPATRFLTNRDDPGLVAPSKVCKRFVMDTSSRALIDFSLRANDTRDPVVLNNRIDIPGQKTLIIHPTPIPSNVDYTDTLDDVVGYAGGSASSRLSETSFWNIIASEFMRDGRSLDKKTKQRESLVVNSYIVSSRTRDLDEIARVPGGIEIAIMQRNVPKETLDRLWDTRGFMNAIESVQDNDVLDHWPLRVKKWNDENLVPLTIDQHVADKLLLARNKIVVKSVVEETFRSFRYAVDAFDRKIHPRIFPRKELTAEEKADVERWREPAMEGLNTAMKQKTEFIARMKISTNPAVREVIFDEIDREMMIERDNLERNYGKNSREVLYHESTGTRRVPDHDFVINNTERETCEFLARAAGKKGIKSDDAWVERNKERAKKMIHFYRPCWERHEARERRR